MKVYLAGPVSGLTLEDAITNRNEMADRFQNSCIDTINPLRSLSFLSGKGKLSPDPKLYTSALASSASVCTRCFNDVKNADFILVDLTANPTTVSIGTVMEIAWAYQLQIPIVAVGSPDNVHLNHHMTSHAVTFVVPTFDEAFELICAHNR